MRIRYAIVAVAITAAALTACTTNDQSETNSKPKATEKKTDPSKLDDAGKLACDDFAHGYQSAATQSDRVDLAHKVNKWAPSSHTDRIADTGHVLANGATGSSGAWKLAADTFAQACLDAGWKA
ncbi:hypothetical protein [Streptomyces sp. NPDC093223]|uniref:hypothetical protein n=1 Tax=Streptomyces sp. NPDC093223 TaxID=3366033 RepID=UPI00381EBAEA